MKCIVTGSSSGIGRDMARVLSSMGYDLVLVSRNEEKLEELKKELKTKVEIVSLDLTKKENCYHLYELYKEEPIDLFVNNAGCGLFGVFTETDLDKELEMIQLNVVAYHILTKLFLQKFVKEDQGTILNVCSSAGFLAGPRLSTYYATKNYVLKLTMAIYEELRRMGSHVHMSALCPGPVNTNFNQVAHGKFTIDGANSYYVAEYAIRHVLKHQLIIVPTFSMKLGLFFSRFLSWKLLLKIIYKIQYRKK